MYDNVNLTLSKEASGNIGFLNEVPQHLTKVTNEGNNERGTYLNGVLGVLNVIITESNIKINKSSLCKYHYGNNFETLNREKTKLVIEKISDLLHIPLAKANITRIDFATNIEMTYNEKVYYPYLGESSYYNRLEQPNGIYYINKKRTALFYGKIKEQKEKGYPIPIQFQDKNLLRYELRYTKRLREQFNKNQIYAGLLYDETFYYELLKRWKDEYMKIQKISSELCNIKPTTSSKVLIRNLAYIGMKQYEQSKVLNLIKQWQETEGLERKQAHDLRKSIRELSTIKTDSDGTDMISELTKKVLEYEG